MAQSSTSAIGDPPPNWFPNTNWYPSYGYYCPNCLTWISNNSSSFHFCYSTPNSGVSELVIYADFKKMFRRQVIEDFRKTVISKLNEISENTPDEKGKDIFGIDVIEDVFDEVSDLFANDNSV